MEWFEGASAILQEAITVMEEMCKKPEAGHYPGQGVVSHLDEPIGERAPKATAPFE